MTSVKQKTITGMFWTMSERMSVQVVQMLVSIVLARLLEPGEFGLIGMLAIFTAVSQSVLDSGFGSALIQKKDATQTDSSSIFYFNLGLGVLLAAILTLAAPLIARFYQQPILAPMVRVLSLNLIINAFCLVQSSLLTKAMDFKSQFKVQLAAVSISGVVGIVMAYKGMGVWSLVAQMVLNYFIRAVILWVVSTWRPTREFSLESLKSMFSFGSKLLLSGLIYTAFNHVYETFIGKVFTAADVGYYTRAATFENSATMTTSSAIERVTYPALSPLQDDNVALKKAYRKTIKMTLFFHFPVMIGLIAVADPLFRLLLTDKWEASIPFFRILCIVGATLPLQSLNLNILKVKGRSDLYLKLEIAKRSALILAIAISFRWGIMALLWGKVAHALFAYFVNSWYSGKLIDYKQVEQLKDISSSLFTAILMGIVAYLVSVFVTGSHLLVLAVQILAGVTTYFSLNKLIKSAELKETILIVKGFINSILKKGAQQA